LTEAVKISGLDPITNQQLDLTDEIIINDNHSAGEVATKRTEVSSFINFITDQQLNFTNDVTFTGTLTPPPGQELDIVVTDIEVKGELTVHTTASVYGLYLNKHMEDVKVNLDTITDGSSLFWDTSVNAYVNRPGLPDAPRDGDVYARQDGEWYSISGYEAPIDGKYYVRKDAEWVVLPEDSPPVCDDGIYAKRCINGVWEWINIKNFLDIGISYLMLDDSSGENSYLMLDDSTGDISYFILDR